jgi:hypothetical protein
VEAIKKIDIPRNKKAMQSFIQRIHFLRRFIPNFAEIIKLITNMLKKDAKIKWTPESHSSFDRIKKALIEAPILISPNYFKEFLIFSFSSEDTIATVLLQRNDEGYEKTIYFFSKTLREEELKYDIMEKQAYALVKALESFRVYVLQYEIISYVLNSAVKEIFVLLGSEGKRGKWITKLLEYNLVIKPTKLIKGQGLAKLLTDSNYKFLGLHPIFSQSNKSRSQDEGSCLQLVYIYLSSPWYKDIVYFLQNLQAPPNFDKSKIVSLKLKSMNYCIFNQELFWRDPNIILLKCVDEGESKQIVTYFHKGFCGGHHHWKATTFKILRAC